MTEEELQGIFGSTALFDRESSEYKEAVNTNSIIRDTAEKKDDPLTVALEQATHLTSEVKNKYISLATHYMEDMHNNIFRNQFDLNKKYPSFTVDEWNDFLSDRIVSVYINKHKRTLLKAAAEDNLSNPIAKNKRDNLQLIKNLEQQEQNEQNKNICIIRLPDIYN